MIYYIFHVSFLLAICYLLYRLLWEKETYFRFNRWILITCLILSFGLPWLTIPSEWSLQTRVVQKESLTEEQVIESISEANTIPLDEPMPVAENITESNMEAQSVEELEVSAVNEPSATEGTVNQWYRQLDFWQIVQGIYLSGVILFSINFLIQLLLLFFQKRTNPVLKDGTYSIVEINQDTAPFSFWNSIFINPTKYDWETYEQILEHEKIHVTQGHTLDILLAELAVIIQWFNPFAWWYRKAVENNLEYLTDHEMINQGVERRHYQMNLLRVSVPQLPLNLTTNYNQSFLKKRIAMMNMKKSSARSSWKYLLLFPLLALTVITLNPVQLQSQEQEQAVSKPTAIPKPPTPPAPPSPPKPPTPPSAAVTPPTAPEPPTPPTPPIPPAFGKDWKAIGFFPNTGSWTADITTDEVCLQLIASKSENHHYATYRCFKKSAFQPIPTTNAKGPFNIERAAGGLELRGAFEHGEGLGKYTFSGSNEFRAYLSKEGFKSIDDALLFHLFMSDINKNYLAYLASKGYTITNSDLETLAIHQVTQSKLQAYLEGLNQLNFKKPTLNEIAQLAIHDVEMDYIEKMGRDLFKDLTIQQLVEASIHDVDPAYIKELKAMGFEDMDFREVIEFSIHDIDAAYVKELKASGLDLTQRELVEAAIHGVDADFIKEARAMGYGDLDFREIIEFAIHGVNLDYIKQLKEAGYDLDKREIVEAAIHSIDVDFIKEALAAGFDNMDFSDIVQFGIHDIDVDYIRELAEAGLEDLSKEQLLEAAIHGIEAQDLENFSNMGFGDLSFEELIQLGIHGVNADYVNAFKAAGYNNLSSEEIVQARIHGVKPKDLDAYEALGFKNIPIQKLIELHIHNVSPSFIKKVQQNGTFKDLTLDDYIEMKIFGLDKKISREE